MLNTVLKLAGGVPSSKLNVPPNRLKRKSKNSKLRIDFILSIRESTKFLNDIQYLVTLNTRSSFNERNIDIP